MGKMRTVWIAGILAAVLASPVYAGEGRQFGSIVDSAAKGYWSDKHNLTWTWFDGDSVVIGNGPKYSDLHPEVTDREGLLKEYVNYPGEGMTNLNSWGEPKANYDEETLQLLKEFVNSFDWIHSDELTRTKAVHDRIAIGKHGNRYGFEGIDTSKYNGWSVLRDKDGVCMNYAGEFRRLAEYIGLECVTYSPKVNHETCMVKINEQWITLDPSRDVSFWDNGFTVPVDYEVEYHRSANEYMQSESGKRMEKLRELNRQLEQGEISEEEFEKKADDIWN